MIIRAIKQIFYSMAWQYFFYKIERVNFIYLINNFPTYYQTLSMRNSLRFFRDLVYDRATDNTFFRNLNPGNLINTRTLTDTNTKKMFWLGFTFTLLTLKWYILLKKVILWPFKLGIVSFFGSLIGFDTVWFLSLFDLFKFNVPHWVFVQYLTLYSNWLNWWSNSVNIKNLKSIELPKNSIKEIKLNESEFSDLTESGDKLIYNKKKIFIIIGITLIVGIGIWYYYYSDLGGSGTNPGPAGNVNLGLRESALNYSSFTAVQGGNNAESIQIMDNQTRPNVYDPVEEVSNAWRFRDSVTSNVGASTSASIEELPSFATSSGNRGSSSPTGSTDSSDTVTLFNFRRGFLLENPKD